METFNNITSTVLNSTVINDDGTMPSFNVNMNNFIINENYEPVSVFCANCPFNDGLTYTSNPPQYKCTKTGEWHMGNYGCGKVFEKREYVYMGEEE